MSDQNQKSGGGAQADDKGRKPYELLDSAMMVDRQRHVFGDKVMLTPDRAADLEPFGSIRPWGDDDHDLVDDERDLPIILRSAEGREDLAARRIAKRNGKRVAKANKEATAPIFTEAKDTEKSAGRQA